MSRQICPRYVSILFFALLLAILISAADSQLCAQVTDEEIVILQERGKVEGWTFSVGRNAATEYPLSDLCALVEPINWKEEAEFVDFSAKVELPSSFDWREEANGMPPIRNQGGCGSCWAFATVGALECAIKIVDGDVVDLSEQYLVSCNSNDWGCGGGWWAHNYHMWKGDPCLDIGSVLETDFPYRASDRPCDCPYPHTYRLLDWKHIGTDFNIPTVEAIKQAIVEHGPVAVAMIVNSSFQAYNGGVFNDCTSGELNHAVILVGWDDNVGEGGAWLLRNSWSPYWGVDGYAWIKYNCSMIGYSANYVVYPGMVKINSEALPVCSLAIPYSCQLSASAGVGEQQWYDKNGNLSSLGLNLESDGTISGTPIFDGDFSFTAAVDDAFGHDEREFNIDIVKPFIFGDANSDQQVNVGDAVYLTNYIFNEGPAPTPFEEAGNANCEGSINIGDAVYIVNHIFSGGPKPSCEYLK